MDIPVDMPLFGTTKDYIVAFGHLKLIKDRNSNDKGKQEHKDIKKPVLSRLPRNARSISSFRNPKSNGQVNIMPGNVAGTSRQIYSTLKSRTDSLGGEEKPKPSHIPRRRSAKEIPTRESTIRAVNRDIPSRPKPLMEPRNNIQRVQLLNVNPDFCPTPPKSAIITSARPIPTLGHIYREDMSNDTLTDWYLESVSEYMNTPQDSADFNATVNTPIRIGSGCTTKFNEDSSANEPNNPTSEDANKTMSPKVLNVTVPLKNFKTTNENVSAWISSKLDHPIHKSECQSIISSRRKVVNTKASNSAVLIIPDDVKQNTLNSTVKKSVSTTAITNEPNSDNVLEKRATVVISKGNAESLRAPRYFTMPKVNTEVIPLTKSTTDIHKPFKYPSAPNPSRKQENIKIPVASYVEYPSEVLQKTTNFETEAAFATTSNNAGPNRECDNNPSQWTLINHVEEFSAPTDDTVWSRLQSSQESNLVESSKTSYLTEELWREHFIDDKNETNRTKCPDKYSNHDYFNHYCWRKEVVKDKGECPWDYRGRCKKCQKYRKTSERKKKLRQPFQKLKSGTWIGRNCKFGWSRVWKRTTERWTHWSRSTYGFGKLRVNDLKKSLMWDNANVQTTILVFRETGTDAVAKELKSAAITTSLKFNTWASFSKHGSSTSTRSTKSPLRRVNIGPSMFPFLYYPSTVLVDRSPMMSKRPLLNNSYSARNSRENKLKEVMNSSRNSRIRNKSNEGTLSISKSTSLIALPNYVSENGTETEPMSIPVENKVTSTMINFSHIKLADTVSQDAYTQMCVTCSNAATDIKYTPPAINASTLITKSTDEGFYYGVDRGTEMNPPICKSQRSIPVMTSKGIIQELTHRETQVSPEPSIRKISTVVLKQEQYKDAKSSMVTDTSVPCRRFDNTHLVTSKGTILSCTGTKVTSVSSAQIRTASDISRISRVNVVNTAMSTNFVTTKNTDCLTAPSLHRSYLEDVSLGTDEFPSVISEKSTSCADCKTFADTGISTSNLVDRASYNGGSHYSQNSFCSVIHPECSSVCINTDAEMKSKSTGTGMSLIDNNRFDNRTKSTKDCQAQYSEPMYRRSNEAWDNSRYVARIGRSRLMSVRMLSDSVTEMATQAQPVFQSAETNTAFKQKMSAAVFTSRYAIGEPLQSSIKLQPKDTGHILTCNCANTACDTKPIDARERRSQAFAPVRNDVACKTNSEVRSVPKVTSRNDATRQVASNAEPNFVISSNLNATKWMKGCTKESDKDVQSIISISETMVTESLDQASLVIATSKDGQSMSEIKKLSEVVINQPAVGCVTATGYQPSSSQLSISRMLPTKDQNSAQDKNTCSNQRSENEIVIVNKNIISDEVTTKSINDSIHQLRPQLRDTDVSATGFDTATSKKQSASVLTSRHILPNPPRCEDSSKDCIFVYDRPRCIVHSFRSDAVAQTELQPRNSEIPFKKQGSISSRSVGLVTSFSRRSSCSHPKSSVPEVLSPKVYKALYETTKLIAKEGSESTTPKSSTTVKEESETTVPKSSKTEKRGSETTTPNSSFTQPISKKTEGRKMLDQATEHISSRKAASPDVLENEDAIAASCSHSKAMSQMTSCLLSAPAHCCCARCLDTGNMYSRSIQTVTEPVLLCPHCNARLSQTQDLDRDSMKCRSIQAAGASLLNCPQCSAKIAVLSNDSRHESAEECIQSYLVASCRYYSNLLTIKLAQVKDNFKKHIAPPVEGTMYQAAAVPTNIFHRTLSNNIIFAEACTMKPSGRRDENCEAKIYTKQLNKRQVLCPAMSLTDVRGHDKKDLKNVYYILTAIEGRVRRLKSNLTS